MNIKRIVISNMIMVCIGAIVGILSAYLRSFSRNTFWSLSDIVHYSGFWIASVCIITYYSKKQLQAGLHTLLYLLVTNLTYYLSLFYTLNVFYTKQFICWCFVCITSFFLAQLIYKGKGDCTYAPLINALYLTVLGVEIFWLFEKFIMWRTHFLQLVFDVISIIVLFHLYNQTNEKKKYTSIITIDIIIFVKLVLVFINNLNSRIIS